jgi:hypothetical protein
MRRIAQAFAVAVVAGIPLAAQVVLPTFTLKGNGHADATVNVWSEGELKKMGTTDESGRLPFNTSMLSGKPTINVRINVCPTLTSVNLVPATESMLVIDEPCDQTCKCHKKPAAFIWGSSYTASTGGFALNSPLGYGLIGGIGAGTALVVAGGGGDDTANATGGSGSGGTGSGGTGGTTIDFSTILGSYGLNGTTQSKGGCSFNNTFPSTVSLSGTSTATIGQLIESITRNMSGSSTLSGTTWNFALSGSGTIPGLGNYTETMSGQVNGTAMTATESLNLSCGTVVVAHSGTKK